MFTCERCGYHNNSDFRFCAMCGAILVKSEAAVTPEGVSQIALIPDETPLPSQVNTVDPDMVLMLCIGSDRVMMPFPLGSELMLGRHTIPVTRTVLDPRDQQSYASMLKGRPLILPRVVSFLTLAPFGAIEAGVSREHALLQHEYRKITLTDNNSRNGTYLRGVALKPQEKQIVHHGDEIVLGALRITIHFEHQPLTVSTVPIPPRINPA
jgi:hypothetical protein